MRSRRISKRVLASPGGVVMVGVELPYTYDGTYLLREVMAVTTPISVSELSWRPFFKRPKKLRQCGGNSTYGNVTLTPACPTKVLEPSACFSVNSVYGHPERNPPNISVSTVDLAAGGFHGFSPSETQMWVSFPKIPTGRQPTLIY
ncbi:hypothetical protein AVEN_133104-1 [Araneus ventricosus]|uniref:Uncharacterized protein n=1 Tax=Araneus ventricosus TaxID=182803 RepID=A0A4Y2PZV9_ARAVE|nr:hypothetical protein AVEN_53962-1 [Araneus ventricosus]GBN56121.1 hypothetical protein AVEN_64548-1 [Araneus ventricosus]GBN56130.1 hypothetical protein AVEN_105801-1 [Araneus ventricosus]GBN56140.1 hypothetical protein AVEN_133104-1 [Araneus ventricosus]